jgi:hypothetical protein
MLCGNENCERPVHAHGWCRACHDRLVRTAPIKAFGTIYRPRFPEPPKRPAARVPARCTVADCEQRLYRHGRCGAHYSKWYRDYGRSYLGKRTPRREHA